MTRIAIIGAGISGLTLARQLNEFAETTLFEKSRGVSGRMATRRIGKFEFDHGAQYFTARSNAFKQFLKPFIKDGTVATWEPRVLTFAMGEKPYKRDWFEPHYVAVPGMNALCKAMANDLDIRLQTRVTAVRRAHTGDSSLWFVETENNLDHEPFDWVISTAPVAQTLDLLGEHLQEELLHGDTPVSDVRLSPCFTLMLGLGEMPKWNFDAARVKNSGLEWVMVNSSKPGRPDMPCLVLLSTNQWATQNQDADDAWVCEQLLADLETLLNKKLPVIQAQALHRWRYARVEHPLETEDYLFDMESGLAACGDWCMAERVEGAFLSAIQLARRLESHL